MASPLHDSQSPSPWLADPGMNLCLGEAAIALGSLLRTTVGPASLAGERICNDTRLLTPGDIFVALAERRDGHQFVGQALERGARFVIVSQWPLPDVTLTSEQGALVVRDVDAALVRLASWWRGKYQIPFTGIGGGVGKTTTKEAVAGLLAQRYGMEHILKTPANWNDLRGISLALLGLRPHHQRAVIEMGMDRPGEVAQLAEVVHPRWGIVTSVSATHLEYFPGMSELIATERGMVESLPPAPEGIAILNENDRLVRGMIPFTSARVFRVGTLPDIDLRATNITSQGVNHLSFVVHHEGKEAAVHTTLIGRHLITTALSALAVALADEWTLADAAEALEHVTVSQRIRFRPGLRDSTVIDDTYNASPESMRAALDILANWPLQEGSHRFAILGTMRELGPRSWREHHRLGRRAAACCSSLWAIGEEREALASGARAGGLNDVRSFASPAEAMANCAAVLQAGDVTLVKASHAVGLNQVISTIIQE
jgi:UDP-N-acetylmuramoyl-tripeptide--D-alanyl-D-alanine ligase